MKDIIEDGIEKGGLGQSETGKVSKISEASTSFNNLLNSTIHLNDGIKPNTSEMRIQNKANLIAEKFDNETLHSITNDFQSLGFVEFADFFSNFCMHAKDGNEILERLQNMTSRFRIDKNNVEYSEGIMNLLSEYDKKIGIENPSHNNDIIFSFMYLLYETMHLQYELEFGKSFKTDEQKKQFELMMKHSKTVKVS